MTMSEAKFQCGGDTFANWRDDVLSGTPPTLYPIGTGELARIEIGLGLVTLFGGAPGSAKTALTMQGVVDALRLTETLKAVICNIEMPPAVLMDRQLARLSGIALTTIRRRQLGPEHADRIDQALTTIEAIADRLVFCRPPFDLVNVAATADAFDADLLLLDYIQRIRPPGDHADPRRSVDVTMDYLRKFADEGFAVIVVSAVGRGKDSKGRSSYASEALSLASFRESSELEFGADDAFLLAPDAKDASLVTLRHLKARYCEKKDLPLRFEGTLMRFTPLDAGQSPSEQGQHQSELQALWEQTAPAQDDEEGDENDD
jgi:replicative DNA helicase